MEPVRTVLANGARLIVVPMAVPTVTVHAVCETGLMHETKRTNGISHFIEHLAYMGTKDIRDLDQFLSQLERISIMHNAETGIDSTEFYLKVRPSNVLEAIHLLASIYCRPLYPKDEVENERGVVIGEVDMYRDTPEDFILDSLPKLIYGDQPAGWMILGPKKNVHAFTRRSLLAYHARHYRSDRTIVVVAGDVSIEQVMEAFRESDFAGLEPGRHKRVKKPTRRFFGISTRIINKNPHQVHLGFGCEVPTLPEEQAAALEVLSAVLSGGRRSRIFRAMRTTNGLGYYASGQLDASRTHTVWTAQAGVHKNCGCKGVRELLAAHTVLRSELVSAEELEIAQVAAANGHILETSDEAASYYARQEVLRRPLRLPAVEEDRINSVTAHDIRDVARKIFTRDNVHLIYYGPDPEIPLSDIVADVL